MDGNLTPYEVKIFEAIDKGTLTNEQLEGGLVEIIRREMEQNERPANMELVNACEDLLFRIHRCEYISRESESLVKAKVKLEKRQRRKRLYTTPLKIAATVIILICGSFIADVLIQKKNLVDYSTVDEQQHIITGNVIEGPFIDDGLADNEAFLKMQSSKEWQDAVETLGYVPKIPTWMPEGWEPQDYYASSSQFVSVFRIKYACSNNEFLTVYSETQYADIETATAVFEQSENGEVYRWNGWNVYVSKNIEKSIAFWIEDTTCYSISGPITVNEIEQIVCSIKRSDK